MEELHLDHNDVGVEGALALAGAMEATATLPSAAEKKKTERIRTRAVRHMDASTSSSMRDMDASTSSSASWWWRPRDGARGRRARVSLNPHPPPRARRPARAANADAPARAGSLAGVASREPARAGADDALAKIHALAFANAGDASRDVETIPSASAEDVARAEREDAEVAEAERARVSLEKRARRRDTFQRAFADRVAARAAAAYRRVLPNHSRDVRGAAVVAAVVAHENAGDEKAGDGPGAGDVLKVLSVGVGTKFVPPEVAAAAAAAGPAREGTYVRDSHAEVLARRGFRRFLLREMRELAEKAAGADFASAGPRRVADGSNAAALASSQPVGAGGGFRARARASRSTCTSPPRRAAARPRPHRRGSKPSTPRGGAFEIVVVKDASRCGRRGRRGHVARRRRETRRRQVLGVGTPSHAQGHLHDERRGSRARAGVHLRGSPSRRRRRRREGALVFG